MLEGESIRRLFGARSRPVDGRLEDFKDFDVIMNEFLTNYEILGGKMKPVLSGSSCSGFQESSILDNVQKKTCVNQKQLCEREGP